MKIRITDSLRSISKPLAHGLVPQGMRLRSFVTNPNDKKRLKPLEQKRPSV
ncbi:hypothetical protein [Spirosoma endophyticum]|uniref:hypothetical protein n=1 Tax=Spirosoma endophyticum TaxID=662367 RepID=UPI0015A603F2|nr:hypothetical protein [Spirosoma endophyticum]